MAEKADEICADYRSDDVNENVREALVETVFKNAVNAVFGNYNPTAELVTDNPNVLVSRCLDTLQTMVDKQQPILAGVSCWLGGGSDLVLPGGTN